MIFLLYIGIYIGIYQTIRNLKLAVQQHIPAFSRFLKTKRMLEFANLGRTNHFFTLSCEGGSMQIFNDPKQRIC